MEQFQNCIALVDLKLVGYILHQTINFAVQPNSNCRFVRRPFGRRMFCHNLSIFAASVLWVSGFFDTRGRGLGSEFADVRGVDILRMAAGA
ncbi:MAG: hypothetical protein ACKVQW_06025 [Pyrinomonadaceae bacterium]